MSNFHTHFGARPKLDCTHDDKSCTVNGTPVCRECFNQYRVDNDAIWAAAKAESETCEICQKVKAEAEAKYANRRCASCGAAPSESLDVSTHSGVFECGRCWTWRKLDGPAAGHWNRAASKFLSNVDIYDCMTFMPERIGLDQDEFSALISMVRQIADKTQEMIDQHTHHPLHPANKEA